VEEVDARHQYHLTMDQNRLADRQTTEQVIHPAAEEITLRRRNRPEIVHTKTPRHEGS